MAQTRNACHYTHHSCFRCGAYLSNNIALITTPFLCTCLVVFVTRQLLIYSKLPCLSQLFKKYHYTLFIHGGQENFFLSGV